MPISAHSTDNSERSSDAKPSTLAAFRKQYEEGKLVAKNDPRRAQKRRDTIAQRQHDQRAFAALQLENRKLKALVELQKNFPN